MNGWLEIRDTGVSVLQVLRLLSQGYSHQAICERLPVTDEDIRNATLLAHNFLAQTLTTAPFRSCSSTTRQLKNAGETEPPTLNDDIRDEIDRLHGYGATPYIIARLLRITPGQVSIVLDELAGDP